MKSKYEPHFSSPSKEKHFEQNFNKAIVSDSLYNVCFLSFSSSLSSSSVKLFIVDPETFSIFFKSTLCHITFCNKQMQCTEEVFYFATHKLLFISEFFPISCSLVSSSHPSIMLSRTFNLYCCKRSVSEIFTLAPSDMKLCMLPKILWPMDIFSLNIRASEVLDISLRISLNVSSFSLFPPQTNNFFSPN